MKALFRKANFSRRISKWAIKIREYDVTFKPQTVVKGKVVANFLVEFSLGDKTPDNLQNTPIVVVFKEGGNMELRKRP